jgi:phage terminase small subunit
MPTLTPKQRLFVDEYIIDFNATAAAVRAGYSPKTAVKIGSENIRKPDVQAAIQEVMSKRESRTQITQDRVLQEFARIAFLDPKALFDDEGKPRRIVDLSDDTAAAIAGLDVVMTGNSELGVGQVQKIKIADKIQALTQLARHLGMLNDKIKVSGDPENPLLCLLSEISGKSIGPK